MRRINVGVLGCGFWGRNQTRVFSELDSANLSAVADIDRARAKEVGEHYHVDWYTDVSRLVERKDLDLVTVCTPSVTHAEMSLKAIDAGKHVLVEKPMTSTVEEGERLVSAAKRKGIRLAVGFIERFNPGVVKAHELLQNGTVGNIVLATARRVSWMPERIGDVGVVKDLAIHDVDVVRFLFNEKISKVYSIVGSLAHKYEDYASIVLKFSGDTSAFIESNWLTPRKVRRLTVTGSSGIITVEYISQEVTVEKEDMVYLPIFRQKEPLKEELRSIVDSLLAGEAPTPTGEDGVETLRVCEAVLKSGREHAPVNL